jgi:hypothetical protein
MKLKKRITQNIEEFKIVVSNSKYISDIIKYYGCKKNGGVKKVIKSLIKESNISTDHFSKELPQKKYFNIEKECPYCHKKFQTLNGGKKERKTCSVKCGNSFSRHTDESKKKISNSLKGRKIPDHIKRKISLSLGGNGVRKVKKREWAIVNGIEMSHKECISCKQKKYLLKYKRICDECKFNYYYIYRPNCEFDFNIFDYPNKFDLTLVKKYGIYSPINKRNNLNGVSRDHLYSVKDGFKNKIEPDLIKHPANCSLILQTDNSSKNCKSIISFDELKKRIEEWDN